MSEKITLFMVVLIAFCIVMEAISQLCFKHAADSTKLTQIVSKPILWLGILIWGIEVITWLNVLEQVPLSIAYPIMSLTYVTTLIAGTLVFKEHINKRHAIGAILITVGVACVGATGI